MLGLNLRIVHVRTYLFVAEYGTRGRFETFTMKWKRKGRSVVGPCIFAIADFSEEGPFFPPLVLENRYVQDIYAQRVTLCTPRYVLCNVSVHA